MYFKNGDYCLLLLIFLIANFTQRSGIAHGIGGGRDVQAIYDVPVHSVVRSESNNNVHGLFNIVAKCIKDIQSINY